MSDATDEPTTAPKEPTSQPTEDSANTEKPAWRILRPVSAPIAVALLLQVLGSLASAIPLLALVRIVNELLLGTDKVWSAVWWFIGGLGGALALGSLALLITHLVDLRLQAELRVQLADKLSRLPLGWFDQSSSGRVRRIIQDDVASLHHLVAHALVEITAAVLTPVVGVIVALTIDWRLGLCCVISPVAYMVLFSVLAPGDMRSVMARIAESLSEVSAAVIEFVDGIAVLRVFGAEETGSARFTRASDDFTSEFRTLVTPQMRAHAIALTALGLPVVALTVVVPGAAMVAAGWSDVADVVVVTMIALSLPATLLTVGAGQQHINDGLEAAGRLITLLDEPELLVAEHPLEPAGTDVSIENVTFGYAPDEPVLHGVSLTAREGSVTALVGASGSGKSTLASLIARFRDVDAGAIRIGNVDVRDIDPHVLHQHVGILLQSPSLPSMSIRDNIALGRPGATDEDIQHAASLAAIDARIRELPRGYGSVVGEDARLSGGETQRVAIARAILADPHVLILDEATSAIDPENEAAIGQALAELARGRTVIMIAHRLGTITHADQIVVLDQGRIVEQGEHESLLAADGQYAALWRNQAAVTGGAR